MIPLEIPEHVVNKIKALNCSDEEKVDLLEMYEEDVKEYSHLTAEEKLDNSISEMED